MRRIFPAATTLCLLMYVFAYAASPPAAARGRRGKGGKNKAVLVMKVGDTKTLLFRDFRSPRIKNPAIVKLVKSNRKRCYFLRAKKRGVTELTYNTPFFPSRRRMKMRLKIIVR
jgi:hypothetical protein